MIDDKYTIPHRTNLMPGLKAGTTYAYWSNGVCCEVVGDYCMWPKKEPRVFVVTAGVSQIAISNKKEAIDKIWLDKEERVKDWKQREKPRKRR